MCGVIVVDAESIGLLVLDVMPIDIIIAVHIQRNIVIIDNEFDLMNKRRC